MIDYWRVRFLPSLATDAPYQPVALPLSHFTRSKHLTCMTSHDIECFNFAPITVMRHKVITGFCWS